MTIKKSKNELQNHSVFCKAIKQMPLNDFKKRFKGTVFYLVYNNNKIVGLVTITDRNEIGYGIIEQFRRKNLAKDAIKELMIKEKRPYYWSLIDKNNEVSMKFIQSLGFVPRGIVYGYNT